MSGFLWDRLGDVHDLDVLDLSRGHGWLAEELRRAGARVVGIDGSGALLAEVQFRHPLVKFKRHDLGRGCPIDRLVVVA